MINKFINKYNDLLYKVLVQQLMSTISAMTLIASPVYHHGMLVGSCVPTEQIVSLGPMSPTRLPVMQFEVYVYSRIKTMQRESGNAKVSFQGPGAVQVTYPCVYLWV